MLCIASLFASKFKAVSGGTNVARDRQVHVGAVKQLNVGMVLTEFIQIILNMLQIQ